MNLAYSINGIPFTQLGIQVSDSTGIVDGLDLKDPFTVDWPDAHGEVVDLTRPRFQARQIRLECWMAAPSADAFISQSNALFTQLVKFGTLRLMLTPVAAKPLVFEVYAKGGLTIKKDWRDGAMIGSFSLAFTEPQPAKWVLAGTGTVSVNLSAVTPITIYWGDGSKTEVVGANQTVSHTYGGTAGVVYYVIVSGELERMSVASKNNLTEIWPRLY